MKTFMYSNAMIEAANEHPQRIMNNWIQSVDEFYRAFDQLATHAARFVANSTAGGYMGQCPKGQVFQLLATMKRELARLLDDMDQSSGLANLAAHTTLIRALVSQAAITIQLINWSAS